MPSFARTRHHKDEEVEERLAEVNARLEGAFEDPALRATRPLLLIVGHQRSGTTLVNQVLTSALELGYPSNLIARFWLAPLVGVAVQRGLAAHLAPDAPGQAAPPSSFASELGTTRGLLEPHEFSYFWNHWFPGELTCRDPERFRAAIGNLEAALDRPLAFKNNFNTLRISLLAELLPTAVFVLVRRDLLDVACSTLDARRRRFGVDEAWFGIRPPACQGCDELPPPMQIAAQIFHTERAIAEAAAKLPPGRLVEVDYAEFCAGPERLVAELGDRGIGRRSGALPSSFTARSAAHGHPDAAALQAALDQHFEVSELP